MAGSGSATHGNEAAAHAPDAGTTCFGCHTDLVGKNLADLHSAATTTVAGVTRTSCMICHSAGVPTTKTCTASGCHADKGAAHQQPANHAAGTDAGVRAARFAYYNQDRGGCSDTDGLGSGCHDIGNIATLHESLPGNGCNLCHFSGKTPKSECNDCHKIGSATDTMPLGTRIYHHLNSKYLNNPAEVRSPGDDYFLDANANMGGVGGYWDAPASSWDMTRFDYDCAASCHSGTALGGTFPVFGGSGKKGYEFGGPLTEKIWDGGGTEGRAWVQVDRFLTSTNPIQWTPGQRPDPLVRCQLRLQSGRPVRIRRLVTEGRDRYCGRWLRSVDAAHQRYRRWGAYRHQRPG